MHQCPANRIQDTSPLDLPLTANARLQQTRDMAASYYRATLLAAS